MCLPTEMNKVKFMMMNTAAKRASSMDGTLLEEDGFDRCVMDVMFFGER